MSAALEVKCPLCDAPPNEACVQFYGGQVHRERLAAAVEYFKKASLTVTREQLVNDQTYETWAPTSEDGAIIGEGLAQRLATTRDEVKAFTVGAAYTHPSQVRDRLWKLGYVLYDLRREGQVQPSPVATYFEADEAIYLALTGGDAFLKKADEWEELKRAKARGQLPLDHAYLSAGDNPNASGDRAYTGCSLCGRPRSEHKS